MALFGKMESCRIKRVVNSLKVLFRKVSDVMQENQGDLRAENEHETVRITTRFRT
jgi:hypothetical protein